ncbi:DUF222 domain-containing protein [Staphylococcus chromogenes]|nr:DUF222 domain-containing protein [Staphylococcus chromogenes]
MGFVAEALESIRCARLLGADSCELADLFVLKEEIARLETELAKPFESREVARFGCSRGTAQTIVRRASYPWADGVSVEHQDIILAALENLSASSTKRQEIYNQAADAAQKSSPWQTAKFVRALVREENQRLANDPLEAYRQRRFAMRVQDEHGGVQISGYLPPAEAALLQSMMDVAFGSGSTGENDLRTVQQRNADAFGAILRWASAKRVDDTGHASLVVSVTEDDEMDLFAKFATNTSVDLSLFDIDHLAGDRIVDYVVVHDHNGAVKSLRTANRHANFWQRIGLLAEQLVCQHPGCDVHAGRCDAHHVFPWSRGGRTTMENLALLCRNHHRGNDDNWVREHLEKWDGKTHWVTDGESTANESPAAKRAGGKRVTEKN